MTEEVYTIAEVAKKLRVSEATVRRMIDAGELQAFKVHNQWRIRREELERIMKGEK
jgi:excisionase family DNA binding protein